jgi:hypothetical protein
MGRGSRERRSAGAGVEALEARILMSSYDVSTIRKAYGFDQLGLDGSGQVQPWGCPAVPPATISPST